MALERRLVERAELGRRLRLVMAIVVIGAILVVGAAIVLGWTLPPGPDFTITTDPAGELPF